MINIINKLWSKKFNKYKLKYIKLALSIILKKKKEKYNFIQTKLVINNIYLFKSLTIRFFILFLGL